MAALKQLLLNHGEKLGLGVVVAVCLFSIIMSLARDRRDLELPSGKTIRVERAELEEKISTVRKHLDKDERVTPFDPFEKVSLAVAKSWLPPQALPEREALLDWIYYTQPPVLRVRQLYYKPIITQEDVPAKVRSVVAAPANYQIRVGPERIAVVCEDPPELNWLQQGSVRVMLWRKLVGTASEEVDTKVANRMQQAPRSRTVAKNPASMPPPREAAKPTRTPRTNRRGKTWEEYDMEMDEYNERMEGYLREVDAGRINPAEETPPQEPRQPSYPRGSPPPETREDTGETDSGGDSGYGFNFYRNVEKDDAEEDADTSKSGNYLEQIKAEEFRVFNDFKQVATPTAIPKTEWELLAEKMIVLDKPLSDKEIKKILSQGLEAAMMAREETVKEEPEKTDETEAEKPEEERSIFDELDPSRRFRSEAEEEAPAERAEETAGQERQRRTYIFVDDQVRENQLYRYRLLLVAEPKLPPEEVLSQEEHATWDMYVTLKGAGDEDRFAEPWRFVDTMLKAEKPAIGFEGIRLTPPTAREMREVEYTAEDGNIRKEVKQMPRSLTKANSGKLTARGQAYALMNPVCSNFVYSDLMLVPVPKRLRLRSILPPANGQPALVSIRVAMVQGDKTEEKGYMLNAPRLNRQIQWHDWLAKEDDGEGGEKLKWPPEVLSPTEVYNKIGVREMEKVPIGDVVERDGEKWDFRTNWGLVDVRPYIVRRTTYRQNENGEWEKTGPPFDMEKYCIVVGELRTPVGQERRFKRIFKKDPDPKERPGRRFEIDYVWEPEVETKVMRRLKELREKRKRER